MNTERNKRKNREAARATLRRRRVLLIVLIVCLLLLAADAAVLALRFRRELKESAYAARDDLYAAADCIARQDAAGAKALSDELEADAERIEALLASPEGQLAAAVPGLKADLDVMHRLASILGDSTRQLLRPFAALMEAQPLSALKGEDGGADLAVAESYLGFVSGKKDELLSLSRELDELSAMPCRLLEKHLSDKRETIGTLSRAIPIGLDLTEEVLAPGVEFLRDYPLTSIKDGEGGLRVEVVERYLGFAEEKVPLARAALERLDALGLEDLVSSEHYEALRGKAEELLTLWDETEAYRPLLRAFLGGGEDRLYVFAAQNSSEIRASGGFPGSVGTVRIRNGVLTIGDFQPVNSVLSFYQTSDTVITPTEAKIFGDWFYAPRDADFCPDFERVAGIWASAYEYMNGERVDGALSATPVIIQRLLSVAGEVVLSDGTVLNGTNAARELEYDMYYRYFSYGSSSDEGNELSDALFAETASKVMDIATDEIGFTNAAGYLSVFKESAADRTLMLWLRDEGEQALVRAAGLDCGLNSDPARPAAGIYFSLTNPSRMGWFLDMDPAVELLETHEDGSKTYAVRLEMKNVMTEAELMAASWYISGSGTRGTVTGYLYLFAPAGGTIGEVSCSDSRAKFAPERYHELDLQYSHQIIISAGELLTVEYTVTTAPCEQEELALSMTPTLQAYR